MVKETWQKSLEAAWKSLTPYPRNKTEFYRAVIRRRGLADTKTLRLRIWTLISDYYNGKFGYEPRKDNRPRFSENQGSLF